MTLAQGCLIAALVGVAITHTMSRVGGALATIGWCAAAIVFGVVTFEETGGGLTFLGIETPPWVYVGAMIVIAGYNVSIVARATRRGRAMPSTTTPSPPAT